MRDKVRTDQRGGGSASVGMLLLVPAIMLIAFGGIEIGLWYHAHQSTPVSYTHLTLPTIYSV